MRIGDNSDSQPTPKPPKQRWIEYATKCHRAKQGWIEYRRRWISARHRRKASPNSEPQEYSMFWSGTMIADTEALITSKPCNRAPSVHARKKEATQASLADRIRVR